MQLDALQGLLQGAAIGGEMPGAWVFVAEHVPARRYGFGIGTLTSGITGGILLGSLVAVAINRHYTPADVSEFAWRIPFILGGVFGLVSVYLRRFLHEPPVFQELAGRRNVARELPLRMILREHRPATVFVALPHGCSRPRSCSWCCSLRLICRRCTMFPPRSRWRRTQSRR